MTKPILKWVGGKTQLIDTIVPLFPRVIQNYYEPFVGGGSVLLAVLANRDIAIHGNIYATDANAPLIGLYKNIQTNHIALFDNLQTMIAEYNDSPEYYYAVRERYNAMTMDNKCSVAGSALFLFINKTCFRGMFRLNRTGGFNVPFGNYKHPEIINRSHLEEIHNLIQPVIFGCCDFETTMKKMTVGDFAYLDPPYVPENNTSFVGYTSDGFDGNTHTRLFDLCKASPGSFVMSNSDTEFLRGKFTETDDKYHIRTVECRRRINSKRPNATTNEIILTNYR
jgi:DNA adenine methylase